MATTVEELDISEAQKAAVRNIIANATTTAAATAVEQAKVEFRAGVAGTRRPEVFDPSKMSTSAYFECFEPFRKIVGLSDEGAVQSFQTYLDPKSLTIVQALPSASGVAWNAFKTAVIRALSSPSEAVQARFELKRAAQRADETVAQFGDRLRELGRLGYNTDQDAAKESALKDALAGGVLRDEISIFLIGRSEDTFSKCLEEAVKLDSAYRARSSLKENDSVMVSVLKNEFTGKASEVASQTPAPYNKYSFTPGYSVAPHAPRNIICHYCRMVGHFARECRIKAYDEMVSRAQRGYQTGFELGGHFGTEKYASPQFSTTGPGNNVYQSHFSSSQDARVQPSYDHHPEHNQSQISPENQPSYFSDYPKTSSTVPKN